MKLTVVIASFGDDHWLDLAKRAEASARPQADDVLVRHFEEGPIERIRNEAVVEIARREEQGDDAFGDWLCFLDADDELEPGFVDAMRDAMIDDIRAGLAAYDGPPLLTPAVRYVRTSTGGMIGEVRVISPPVIPNKHQPMPPLNHCVVGTVVHRSTFADAGGFDASFWPWSDYELWLRCCRHGARVVEVPDAIYRAHVNPGSDNRVLTAREGQALGKRIHDEHRARGGEFPVKGGESG